jgi:FkbM family methyltransferase
MLGGRSWALVRSEITQRSNYVALGRMLRRSRRPLSTARRYFLGGGSYPWRVELRTPTGTVAPVLHSHHDVWTVNEVFFREDYPARPDLGVVVDVGSNIGISALWFLSRNAIARCHLYEPVPANLRRLRENLSGLEDRYELHETAVSDRSGTVSFGVEATGRYGGIGVAGEDAIEVPSLEINQVLESVLEREGRIDVLKLDIEGLEVATARAIRPELLERIGAIYLETEEPVSLHPERFEAEFANQTLRLRRR